MPDPTVSEATMRLVRLLVGNPPQSVQDLVDATGVTRTAVAKGLDELVAAGFVRRSAEQLPGKGRPRFHYSVTDAARTHLFPADQSLAVSLMWRAIEDVGGIELKRRVLRRVGRALADHYKRQLRGNTAAERFRELAKVFCEAEGNLVEVEADGAGRLVMRRRNCSFFSVSEEGQAFCQIGEKMVSAIVEAPVRRTACRHDGDHCCIFEIVIDEVSRPEGPAQADK